jgi:subtilisin family serine protease
MRLSVLLAILPAVLAAPAKRESPAPLIVGRDIDALIADHYIVKFKDVTIQSAMDEAVSILDEAPKRTFKNVFKGFSGKISAEKLEALRNHPSIDYIEQDGVVTTMEYVSQTGATWGPTRISSASTGGSTYTYDDSAGEGTCIYIIDTGIDDTHPEFSGRATQLVSFVSGQTTDGNSHGTHCAGIAASNTYGVAKKASLYGVKVLDNSGSGSYAGVISGIDYTAEATEACPNGKIASMSLGGGFSQAVNDAAAALVSSGTFLAVAAGNSYFDDAQYYSPASTESACTVGSTDSNDRISSFSNVGAVVDIFAPGGSILSTIPGGRTGTKSGTSMATPHIAGLAAYLAAYEGITGGVELCERIRELAHKGLLANTPAGTDNYLAFNGNPSA